VAKTVADTAYVIKMADMFLVLKENIGLHFKLFLVSVFIAASVQGIICTLFDKDNDMKYHIISVYPPVIKQSVLNFCLIKPCITLEAICSYYC